tara:strand:- start:15782 stop:16915 length:1134 start_codon:yes stop_codon:yes gene_type:complete
MKILHVLHTVNLEKGGGVTGRNLKLIKYLEKENSENYLISTYDKESKNFSLLKSNKTLFLKVIYLGKFPIPVTNFLKFNNLIKKADIIHLTNFWTLLNLYAYLFCRIHSKRYIICPAGALKIFGYSKFLKLIYKIVVGKKIIKNASCIVAITNREKEEFERDGIPKNKIFTIPNGIELTKNIISKTNKNNEFNIFKPYILFVGRLNYIKGPDLLLDAFNLISKEFPEYNLLFAGPDEGMKIVLENKLKHFNLEKKVLFLGFVDEKRKNYLYKNASILVIPSRSEAMSIVVLEAALHGLTSIFTNVCGLDFLAKNKGCSSVDVSHVSIAKSLRDFLIKYRKNKTFKNEELKEYVKNNFNWNILAKKYIDIFSLYCEKD